MKVILTLTLPDARSSRDLLAYHILSDLLHDGLDVTVHGTDGMLLLDGRSEWSQLNTLRSKPSLEVIIAGKVSTLCESSQELKQSDGIFCTQKN